LVYFILIGVVIVIVAFLIGRLIRDEDDLTD
jgi:hypothetical protein